MVDSIHWSNQLTSSTRSRVGRILYQIGAQGENSVLSSKRTERSPTRMPLTHVHSGKEHMMERKIKICFWIPYGILKFNTFSYLCSKGFSLFESSYQRAQSTASQKEKKTHSNTFPKDVRCRFSHLCVCRRCCCYFAQSHYMRHPVWLLLLQIYNFFLGFHRPPSPSFTLARSFALDGTESLLFYLHRITHPFSFLIHVFFLSTSARRVCECVSEMLSLIGFTQTKRASGTSRYRILHAQWVCSSLRMFLCHSFMHRVHTPSGNAVRRRHCRLCWRQRDISNNALTIEIHVPSLVLFILYFTFFQFHSHAAHTHRHCLWRIVCKLAHNRSNDIVRSRLCPSRIFKIMKISLAFAVIGFSLLHCACTLSSTLTKWNGNAHRFARATLQRTLPHQNCI